MSDPKSVEEHNARFHKAYRVDGHGFGVKIHMPCPVCAAADFVVFNLLDTERALAASKRCEQCGRSFRVITSHPSENETRSEIVCTGGPELPSWAPYRRIDCDRPTDRDVNRGA